MDIHLSNILNIAEVDSLMEIQFMLSMSWRDHRLMFRNLKASDHLNIVSHQEALDIWYPKIVFFNTKEKNVEKVYENIFGNLCSSRCILAFTV